MNHHLDVGDWGRRARCGGAVRLLGGRHKDCHNNYHG